MLNRGLQAVCVVAALATPAWPCSVVGPLPTAEELVQRAEIIVHARALGISEQPGKRDGLMSSASQMRFAILEVLKGTLQSNEITFKGLLYDWDDPNDRLVPYDFVRPRGRLGNCFALGYREGAEYLLLLRREDHAGHAQRGELTPYWSPLAPTNEQVFGGHHDSWLQWVSQHVQQY